MGARLLLASLLYFASSAPVRAEPPDPPTGRPINLRLSDDYLLKTMKVPDGPAPQEPEAVSTGFTLNEDVLVRYGFTLKQYQELPGDEKRRVEDWLRVLEHQRKKAEAREKAGQVSQPEAPVAGAKAQESLLRIRSAAGRDWFMDKPIGGYGDEDAAVFVPRLQTFGPGEPQADGRLSPGALRRFSLSAPRGWTLEGGHLGLDRRSPLVGVSPYLGAGQDGSGETKRLDYDASWRAYGVNLGGRLFTDDAPELDKSIDDGVESLRTFDPAFGIKPENVDALARNMAFSHDYESQWLFYGSAMGRVGRAYKLSDNADVGWSAMGLMRAAGLFPNVTADLTTGYRVETAKGHYFGVLPGMTAALGLFKETMVEDSLHAEKFKAKVRPEVAPHVTYAAWGKIPYLSNTTYSVEATRQWNPWTVRDSARASVGTEIGGVKVGAFGGISDEKSPEKPYANGNGVGFERAFSRTKAAGGLSVSPFNGLDFFAQYSHDRVQLGSAEVDNHGVFFSMAVTETVGKTKGASVTMEALFGGKDQLVSPDDQSEFAMQLQGTLELLLALKDGGWEAVRSYWGELKPETQGYLVEAWAKHLPGAPALDQLMAVTGVDADKADNIVGLLTDTKVVERIIVRVLRAQLLKEMESIDIPILGKTRLSAPLVLMAANAYSLGLSPFPGATAADQETLNQILIDKFAKEAECPPGPAPTVTECLLGKMPPSAVTKLKAIYGDDLSMLLHDAVDWPSGVLRRELNRLALQVMLAAEALNELAVDKGEKIGDLNVRGLMKSFSRLDAREKRGKAGKDYLSEAKRIRKEAIARLEKELKEQDAAMRVKLTQYGSDRLAWLQSQEAWPSNVQIAVKTEDWAELLSVYGDAKIFDLILRCKAKLLAAHPSATSRLMIELGRSPLGAGGLERGTINVLSLPVQGRDLSTLELNF